MIVKLQFTRGKWAEMMQAYNEMLTYIRSAVTRNYSEKVRRHNSTSVLWTCSPYQMEPRLAGFRACLSLPEVINRIP
jgi:hypothetical protein